MFKTIMSIVLALSVCLCMAAGGKSTEPSKSAGSVDGETGITESSESTPGEAASKPVLEIPEPVDFGDGTYTYKSSASTLPSLWNPHTYKTADDAVYFDHTTSTLYSVFFNDELHPHEDESMEPFSSYVIVPDMAADYPVDVTEEVKASHPQFLVFPRPQQRATPGV